VGQECAGDLIEAKRIPLDMYVMLDVSGSMLEPTEGDANVTKWKAVSSALSDFVNDGASAGIGMGLQVFPIRDPAAPTSCKADKDCGTFGPCFLKTCWPPDDLGLQPCTINLDCATRNCVEFGVCANNADYICPTVGGSCDVGTNDNFGNCIAKPDSVCLQPTDCRAATYATPAAPIAELPAGKAGILAAIAAAMPEGLTPSGPALQGAIDQASSWAKAHPDRQVVAVLATDGLPTLCTPLAIADVAALAAKGTKLTPAVSTFVIGVVGSQDAAAPANLNSIAKSGGTKQAFIVDTMGNVQVEFRDALNQIRATGLSCDLAVPAAEAGKAVNYDEVNVTFDAGSGPMDLIKRADATGCNADGGWYYDVDPSKSTPTRIETCPTTCTEFQKTDMGSVQIKLGCKARVK
jgi:hypothetical protein